MCIFLDDWFNLVLLFVFKCVVMFLVGLSRGCCCFILVVFR